MSERVIKSFTIPQNPEVTYHKYTCSECGEEAKNTYSEPFRSRMFEQRICWSWNPSSSEKPPYKLPNQLTKTKA
jgi:hypothetical protein